MKKLPVIVGFGGINAAGRTSMHHGHKRMVFDALSDEQMQTTWQDLATLMQLDIDDPETSQQILNGTLVRRIEGNHYNPDAVESGKKSQLNQSGPVQYQIKKIHLPETLPENWKIIAEEGRSVTVEVEGSLSVVIPDSHKAKVSSAGQLPTGFDPARLYKSANHPRGLQMTVYGASDALQSIGISWLTIVDHLSPEQVSVYAGSAISQLDQFGMKGIYQAGFNGKRTTSKMMPLALPEMAADFVNSYIINSVGNTGTNIGACATFLYNLRQGLIDIQSGQCRVAIVGGAEAPVVPEILEGFRVMGALAEDDQLKTLDGNENEVNNRRACRPFSDNAGFTMAESAQFLILMDDELAMELGATVFGAVADVFVNADANKKSISGPGVGNYVTMARATALAKGILEDDIQKTFVMAHGTGTPQNRVTESQIMSEVAKTFDIDNWAVSAVKSYLGHSLGPAAGDQITAALGVWNTGFIPGIKTIDHLADDVEKSNLSILMDHHNAGDYGQDMYGAVINSKGFGGNNASALILSPEKTLELMNERHGIQAMTDYLKSNETVLEAQLAFDEKTRTEGLEVVYSFGESVMTEEDIEISQSEMKLSEFKNTIQLPEGNPYLK